MGVDDGDAATFFTRRSFTRSGVASNVDCATGGGLCTAAGGGCGCSLNVQDRGDSNGGGECDECGDGEGAGGEGARTSLRGFQEPPPMIAETMTCVPRSK